MSSLLPFLNILLLSILSRASHPISVRDTLFGHQWRNNIDSDSTFLDVSFTDSTYTSYTISVNNNTWLNSATTGFRNGGDWASLKVNRTETTKGGDAFGAYNDMAVFWTDTKDEAYEFGTIFRVYADEPDIIVFIQVYPNGAVNTSTGNPDKVISSFPSFTLDNKNLGFNQWGGSMAGDSESVGKMDGSTRPEGGLNDGGGPFCIFDADMTTAIVLSPLTNHFVASDYVMQNEDNKKYEMQWGLLGSITMVEKGFTTSFILSAGQPGVNAAMLKWGDRQLEYFGKERNNAHNRDFTLNYLGYSTDNGAYYYYETEPNKNYQQTMIDVKAYHDKMMLPTKWVLLDSWWYYKGDEGGVKNWTARDDVFPDGLAAVYEGTKWKIQAHNRYWSLDNVYSNNIDGQTEVGNYPFTWGHKSALPTTQEFWNYFFDINMDWGLIVYEQDWESTSTDDIPMLINNTYFGRQWLMQMGRAADSHDVSIQYCMDFTRNLMTSVELSSVTQARASGDYHPGNDQWKIGVTSIFTSAIDIAPSKDSYWSMPDAQSGHYSPGTKEPYNRLQSAVISLSNGPLTFADRIGYSNADLIMRCCSTSGLVLRPDSSATMIDSYFKYRAGFGASGEMSSGEIWSATSRIGGNEMFRYMYIFAVELDNDLEIYPKDVMVYGHDPSDKWLVYETNATDTFYKFDDKTALKVKKGGKYDFQLFTMIPVVDATGWYLQGEVDKWITVSGQRFKEIARNMDGTGNFYKLEVRMIGEIGEKVKIGFVKGDDLTQKIVECTFDETEEMVIRISDSESVCQPY